MIDADRFEIRVAIGYGDQDESLTQGFERRHNFGKNFDVIAHGEMLEWVFETLRCRLGPMLERAGGGAIAAYGNVQLSVVGSSFFHKYVRIRQRYIYEVCFQIQ